MRTPTSVRLSSVQLPRAASGLNQPRRRGFWATRAGGRRRAACWRNAEVRTVEGDAGALRRLPDLPQKGDKRAVPAAERRRIENERCRLPCCLQTVRGKAGRLPRCAVQSPERVSRFCPPTVSSCQCGNHRLPRP